jgi:hypothetical protein
LPRVTESPPPRLRLLVTPDTILRWHREIIRRRWAARSVRGKTGRPATRRNIKALILRLACENPDGRGRCRDVWDGCDSWDGVFRPPDIYL